MKAVTRRLFSGAKLIEVAIAIGLMLIGPLCAATAQSGASWTQAELIQRARADILLENMASRIRANTEGAEGYIAIDIGAGPPQTCDSALSLAEMDLCEWANLLRGAAAAQGKETAEDLVGARGCISHPNPHAYVISIKWQGEVRATPPGADCSLSDLGYESPRRALLTVVRVAQDS